MHVTCEPRICMYTPACMYFVSLFAAASTNIILLSCRCKIGLDLYCYTLLYAKTGQRFCCFFSASSAGLVAMISCAWDMTLQ